MHIGLKHTLTQIEKSVREDTASLPELKRAYRYTLQLQSQLLSVIYDREGFGGAESGKPFAQEMAKGCSDGAVVTLTIYEALPSMKRLTEAVEEHWKAMLHSAIREAAGQKPLPYFEMAHVGIEIVTPKGSDNARVWDTSNRAIQVILNNLKVIFFHDDDMEHMAFSVFGRWGEEGKTIIRVSDCREITADLEGKIPPQMG